jgi:FkbM family methyltransferase
MFSHLKKALRAKLTDGLRLRDLEERLCSDLRQRLQAHDSLNPFGDSLWHAHRNMWEPPVQHALRDLIRAGAVVYDVGANFGGLTAIMSRLVGPRGVVVSFEASPRIIGHLQANVVKQGFNNVYVQHRAVFSRSGEVVDIYPGDHLNDSIYRDHSPANTEQQGMKVTTVCLDDFISETRLVPEVIKMDIEGAEFDALLGARRTLETHRPYVLLEQQADDKRCLDFMDSLGYQCLDLNNYQRVRSPADYPTGAGLRNIVAVHASVLADSPYQLPFAFKAVAGLGSAEFRKDGHSLELRTPLRLPPGRYLVDADFTAAGADNEMMCGVEIAGTPIFRYHAYTRLLAGSYRDWVFDLEREDNVNFYFRFLNGTSDPTFVFNELKIRSIEGIRHSRLASLVLD